MWGGILVLMLFECYIVLPIILSIIGPKTTEQEPLVGKVGSEKQFYDEQPPWEEEMKDDNNDIEINTNQQEVDMYRDNEVPEVD
mmetsp:Transcript_32623/g.5913  ORF Transcript_32623/g.5913 Transcript_32623/m.5913 type:complete len:84 (+) Transcript_32623:2545-2796(+)|eukprot:CAMPEP_0168314798 /NCGR_PEP_ID=MMETSP0210-20121227/9475_1 /TAXON_ID=40633 /ORGANISM="Condylostoma magnum, Strain COL2" /LENGTH=83 /DNA_ID=CAMNT_0008285063 /DNA_START=2546 /DNA_END=2797 /DNA_ORIENTATION=+